MSSNPELICPFSVEWIAIKFLQNLISINDLTSRSVCSSTDFVQENKLTQLAIDTILKRPYLVPGLVAFEH